MSNYEQDIIRSWHTNAKPWIKAIKNDEIYSRTTVTNEAIIKAILRKKIIHLLDIGCGEGWLIRALSTYGVKGYGIDIIPELILKAQQLGDGHYSLMSYDDLISVPFDLLFDAVVCNFSLLGNDSVLNVFKSIDSLLQPDGRFIVQTIHPVEACSDHKYVDGWRKGSWNGFSADFKDPAPWYYRTIESWIHLFEDHDMNVRLVEPKHPETKKSISIIFIGTRNNERI